MSETVFNDGSPATPPLSAPLSGVAALGPDESYLSVLEADWFVARVMDPASYEAKAWAASTNDRKAALLRGATRKIDALVFRGVRRTETQALTWPRDEAMVGRPVVGCAIDPSSESGIDHLVAFLPRAVRHACAIQAAHDAAVGGGLSALKVSEEAAARGVVSRAQPGGRSESLDLRIAREASARLCRDAQHLLERYLWTQGDAL